MAAVDEFASRLFEEAKRFLEKAVARDENEDGRAAYLHAALSLALSALEAHVSSIADDFSVRTDLSVLERSILTERDFELEDGEHVLTSRLKMYRLEDRIEFLHRRFSGAPIERSSPPWSRLKAAVQLRNRLTHPKEATEITETATREALTAVVTIIDQLYRAIYKRPYPEARRGLDSSLTF